MALFRAQTTEPFWSKKRDGRGVSRQRARGRSSTPASNGVIRLQTLAAGVPSRREGPRPARSQHSHGPAMLAARARGEVARPGALHQYTMHEIHTLRLTLCRSTLLDQFRST